MELQHLVSGVARRKAIVLAAALLGLLGSALVLVIAGAGEYRSTATLLLDPTAITEPDQTPFSGDPERYIGGQIRLLGSSGLAARVAELVPGETAESILAATELSHITGSDVVDVSATSDNAAQARDIANALTTSYVERRQSATDAAVEAQLESTRRQLSDVRSALADLPTTEANREQSALLTQYEELTARELTLTSPGVTRDATAILDAAELPEDRQALPPERVLAAGLLAGLLVGVGASAVLESREPRIGSVAALEAAVGAPVVAISRRPSRLRSRNRRRSESRAVAHTLAGVIGARADTARTRFVGVTTIRGTSAPVDVAHSLVAALEGHGVQAALLTEESALDDSDGSKAQAQIRRGGSDEAWRLRALDLADHRVVVLALPSVLGGGPTAAVLRWCEDVILDVPVREERQRDLHVALQVLPKNDAPLVLARR